MALENIYVKTGMAFGVFDSLHNGHEYFLSEAKAKCLDLIVVVTVPEVVRLLKNKVPRHSLEERIEAIRAFDSSCTVVAGDTTLGGWEVLKRYAPDVVYLGYDQQGIASEMDKLGIAYEFIGSYFPEKYKSSLAQ
jgi:cytidyltransferase-like protein